MTTASSSTRAGDAANDAFLSALVRGDEAAARAALASGADVNATDANGRTSLGCALVGANWETVDADEMHARLDLVRLILSHPNVTLYTLNAPQADMRDVTPLGIAAWSNAIQVVKTCLELGAGTVAVDARDGHSATPLMYAARDARSEVVDELLAHGALPDARDVNLISALQYALPHTQVLRACEDALRGARTREFMAANPRKLAFSPEALPPALLSNPSDVPPPPPSKDHDTPTDDALLATNTTNIVKAVIASDVSSLVSLLFPSAPNARTQALVNRADKDEWSPVHYCASVKKPSAAVLDALFLAGADVNLSSNQGECTPLHCLARKRRGPDALRDAQANQQLYDFVIHLVRDLGAPLAKRSASRETCIHIAAEHGDSAEVLRALLDCDVDRTVCELRNIRGLTALEVAKPEFRYLFGARDEANRPTSAASHLTVTPLRLRQRASSHSILSVAPSVAASTVLASPVLGPGSTESAPESAADAFERALQSLRWVADQLALADESHTADLDHIEARLRDAQTRAIASLGQFYSRGEDVAARLARTNTPWTETDALLDALAQSLDDKEKLRTSTTEPEFAGRARSGTTFSADSARTAVSEASSTGEVSLAFPSLPPELDLHGARPTTPYSRLKSYKSMSDIAQRGRQNSTPSPSLTALSASPVPSMSHSPSPPGVRDSPSPGVRRVRADTIASVRPHTPPSIAVQPVTDKDNTGKRLKAWLKKKLIPERPAPSTANLKTPKSEESPMRTSLSTLCEVPAEEDAASSPSPISQPKRALGAVQRDLARMDEAVADAQTLLAGARRGVLRAKRLLEKAVEHRAADLQQRRLARRVDAGLQALMAWDLAPAPDSLSLAIPSQDSSRATSVPATPSDLGTPHELPQPMSPTHSHGPEGDDAGHLERLVWWKVEDRIETALDAAERVEIWLDVARDVLRGVQLREGLVTEPVAI